MMKIIFQIIIKFNMKEKKKKTNDIKFNKRATCVLWYKGNIIYKIKYMLYVCVCTVYVHTHTQHTHMNLSNQMIHQFSNKK